LFRQNSEQTDTVYTNGIQTGGGAMKQLMMLIAVLYLGAACTPTVKIEAPDKPIEINMNINIKHEILIKVEKQVEELLEDDLF
jgi:hypothetical protein